MYAHLVTDSGGRRPPVIDDLWFRRFCYGYDEIPKGPMTPTEEKVYGYLTKGYSFEGIRNRMGFGITRFNQICFQLRDKRWIR